MLEYLHNITICVLLTQYQCYTIYTGVCCTHSSYIEKVVVLLFFLNSLTYFSTTGRQSLRLNLSICVVRQEEMKRFKTMVNHYSPARSSTIFPQCLCLVKQPGGIARLRPIEMSKKTQYIFVLYRYHLSRI